MGALITTNDNIVISSGKAYVSRYDEDGNLVGERFIGIANDIKASVNTETSELQDYTSPSRPTAARRTIKTNFELAFSVFEKSLENMREFFQGAERTIIQAARNNQTKTLSVGAFDRWYMLEDFYLRNAELVSVKDSNDVAIDTDAYTFDSETSRVKFNGGAGVDIGDSITVTYNVPEKTFKVIEPMVKADQAFFFRFVPDENVQGPRYELIIPRAILTPDGEYGMIDDDITALTFKMSALEYTHEAPVGISRYAKIIELDRASS